MRVSHRFTAGSSRFDDDNLVSHAGLVSLLRAGSADPAARDHRREGVDHRAADLVGFGEPGTKAAGCDREMCACAESIDDLDMLRAGGMSIAGSA